MINIYKKISKDLKEKYIKIKDVFFDSNTVYKLDQRAKAIIKAIDDSEYISQFRFRSRFDNAELNIDKLSTGCKTVLNILYNETNY